MGFTKALIGFFFKFFSTKQLPTILFSFITSSFLTVTIDRLNRIFFKDADIKNVFIPIAIEMIMALIYILMVMADFYFGVRVSLHIKKVKFDYFKVVDSTVKIVATILVTSIPMLGAMTSEAMDISSVWMTSIVVLFFLWVIIILNEFLSLGKNIELLTGSKGRIFIFFERILNILEKKAINKVSNNSFKTEKYDDENNSDNINN